MRKPTIQSIFKRSESTYALLFIIGIIFTLFTINPITRLFFHKDFFGRNLYFQVLFFAIFIVFYMIVMLLAYSFIKQPVPGYKLFNQYDAFYTHHWGILFLFVFILGTILFVVLKKTIFNLDHLRIWKDTTEYVVQTSFPVFSKEFIFGERILGLPLFYKILNVTNYNYTDSDPLFRIAITQFWIGIVAWVTLAGVVSFQFKKHFTKITSFILVYLLALGLPNSQWEKIILSESLSNSMFFLLLALILLTPAIVNYRKKWVRVPFWFLVVLVSISYTFIRDTNAYLLLLASLCIIIAIFFVKQKTVLHKSLLTWAALFVTLFILVWTNGSSSTRWVRPLAHVLEDRKSSFADLPKYFLVNGIDLFKMFPDPETPTRTSLSSTSEQNSKNLVLMQQIKNMYMKFLVTHPIYSFTNPWENRNGIISPSQTAERYNFTGTPDWVTKLSNTIYPLSSAVYPTGILLIIISLVIAPDKERVLKFCSLFLFLSVFPIGWFIWHADTIEIGRHCEQFMIQSRFAFWLSIVFILDCLPKGKKRMF